MAEYTTITAGSPLEVSDGTTLWRLDVRSNILYFDQALTDAGFDGVENADWVNHSSSVLPIDPGATIRVGERSGEWVIDQTLDGSPLGFSGAENYDWDNIEAHSL